jgi:hypothetical protein
MVGGPGGTLAGTTGAFLAEGLPATAAYFASAFCLMRALALIGLLGDHDTVDSILIGLNGKDVIGHIHGTDTVTAHVINIELHKSPPTSST